MSGRTSSSAERTRTRVKAMLVGFAVVLVTGLHLAPAHAAVGGEPAITLDGDPLVHVFDTSDPGDVGEARWALSNTGSTSASWDGGFAIVAPSSEVLAHALRVEYGTVGQDGAVSSWHPAGTLAEPVSYIEGTGGASVLAAGATQEIAVRVTLGEISGPGPAGGRHVVTANFDVEYVGSPQADSAAPAQPGHPGGMLPWTGVSGVLAAAVIGAGALLAGLVAIAARRRLSRETDEVAGSTALADR